MVYIVLYYLTSPPLGRQATLGQHLTAPGAYPAETKPKADTGRCTVTFSVYMRYGGL